ncbi:MAG TPA: tripartite tricarboxylate transporter substrate binding protein [Hyphomicrobiaceae bacterium]|nr:tripartite tricarboxylate transporter substrate binding protein [Hyphomicrobiaceae bacterium]
MLLSRILRSAAALLALACLNIAAQAQSTPDWPTRSVRVIVNFAPGGSADNSMRPFADRLSRLLGQQFVIDNRGGASGALGIEAAVKAPPDGYTFVVTPSLSVVILPHLRKTPYDPLKDLVSVSQFTSGTLLFAVHPSVPASSLPELVTYAKANPGKLSWGTAGVGSYGHLLCETFKLQAGVDILHVPYRGGGESLADFLAGVVQVHADPNTLPHVSAGKAKLFAVLDQQRHPEFPDIPLLKELYPELDFLVWFAMFAPPGTPPAIVRKMSQAMNQVARDPELKPLLLKTALSPHPGTPEELDALLRKDFDRYSALVRKLNLRTE